MNILATQYTVSLKSLDIYVAGCKGDKTKGHCINCHNPESWDFSQGSSYDESLRTMLTNKISSFDNLINNIMIFGGEPLDQPIEELTNLLIFLKRFDKPVWIFTRFMLEEIPQEIKDNVDFLKCGPYVEELKVQSNLQYGINLATSNQKIYKRGIDY